MVKKILLSAVLAGALGSTSGLAAPPLTFCNPMNLDYGTIAGNYRHGADPVVVLFKGRYYLFSTWDISGFRVSDDLVHWRSERFPASDLPLMTSGPQGYCAAAVAVQGDWLYFLNMIPRGKTIPIMRTHDPLSGKWEQCGEIKQVNDPALFFDDDGRAYVYHGLGAPTKVFELDTKTWTEIPGSEQQLRPKVTNVKGFDGGYERGRREMFGETDSGAWLDKFKMLPCQEAAWMTKRHGRYYLQYSTPGTVSQWYCDVAMEGDSPTGPFRDVNYSPVSFKVGGFIGSAGHSGVFQDKYGNWWRATTMWIGMHNLFERRLGLFRVGFDAQGRMFTQTTLGDYPQVMPQDRRDPHESPLVGWWLLSAGKTMTASSTLPGHAPTLAADEAIRTWWSAQSGQAGEWLQVDLGKLCRVGAVQVNFAEQDFQSKIAQADGDFHRYRLLGSADGKEWHVLEDRSQNRTAAPHDYVSLPAPLPLRFVKVENVSMPGGGKFAVSDLRVFGSGDGNLPEPVRGLRVQRHPDDDRNATITWKPDAHAFGYLVRFGVAPDALYQTIQMPGDQSHLTTHVLNRGVRYFWRIDAFNDSGLAQGKDTVETPGKSPPKT